MTGRTLGIISITNTIIDTYYDITDVPPNVNDNITVICFVWWKICLTTIDNGKISASNQSMFVMLIYFLINRYRFNSLSVYQKNKHHNHYLAYDGDFNFANWNKSIHVFAHVKQTHVPILFGKG